MTIGHKGGRRTKLQFTVYLRADQAKDLDDLRAATQVPVAVRIRDAIDSLLEGNESVIREYRENLPKVYKAE